MYSPKKKKLNDGSYFSNRSTKTSTSLGDEDFGEDFDKLVDTLLFQHTQTVETDLYKVVNAGDSTFKIIDVNINSDDINQFDELFVKHQFYDQKRNICFPFKILSLQSSTFQCDSIFYVLLRGQWVNLNLGKGDSIQVFGKFCDETLSLVVLDTADKDSYLFDLPFIIVEPTLLLSPSNITASLPCYRKAIFQMMFSQREDASLPMTLGTMMHELWETLVFKTEEMNIQKAEKLIDTLIKDNLDVLYFLKANLQEIRQEMRKFLPSVKEWANKHIVKKLSLEIQEENVDLKVIRILNAEQMIISHNMGLKGKLDLVMQCEYTSKKQNTLKRAIIPFELKTGENEVYMHNGQTMLYCLLLMQKYKQYENINGLLYYLRKNKLIHIKPKSGEIINLLIRRNFLAKFVKNLYSNSHKLELPPMIASNQECGRCFMNQVCSLVNQTLETGFKRMNSRNQVIDIEETPSFKTYSEVGGSLTLSKKSYFKHWMMLIQLEEAHEKSKENDQNIEDREELNLIEMDNFASFREASLEYISKDVVDNQSLQTITFTKIFDQKERCHIFLDRYKVGDFVKITQSSLACSLKGYIDTRKFYKTAEGADKFYFVSLKLRNLIHDLEVNEDRLMMHENEDLRILWRLEKLSKGFYPSMRETLVSLILDEQYSRLSELIIDEKAPKFKEIFQKDSTLLAKYKNNFNLNIDQYTALEKSLKAQDYNLVLGMPGTGKTYLIVLLLQMLIERGERILLSGYTHSALDNILIRFGQTFPNSRDKALRVAQNKLHVNEKVRDLHYDKRNLNSFEEIEQLVQKKQIFAVTCLSASGYLLNRIPFDVCIIDEASQVLEPTCLTPIFRAKRFVLIGDHYQLQPLVKSKEAASRGFSISLFEKLCSKYPEAISFLTYQYRMNKEIMSLSNALIYNNRLKAANDEISKSKLNLNLTFLKKSKEKEWLIDILDPEKRVVFLNLDFSQLVEKAALQLQQQQEISQEQIEESLSDASGSESNSNSFGSTQWFHHLKKFQQLKGTTPDGSNQTSKKITPVQIKNENLQRLDSKLVVYLTKTLLGCGVSSDELAVITPFNSEKNHLYGKLSRHKVEVYTVDKSQGLDKECIIVNLNLGNKSKDSLLENWRRVNVAFTRAKKKLIIVGSVHALNSISNLKEFISLIVKNRWVQNIEDIMIKQVCDDMNKDKLLQKVEKPTIGSKNEKKIGGS